MKGNLALRFSVLTLAAMLSACGAPSVSDLNGTTNPPVGDDDDDGTTPGTPAVEISAATAADIDLAATKLVPFTVTGLEGFTGDVTVSAVGLPAGVTAEDVVVTVAAEGTPVAGEISLVTTMSDPLPGTTPITLEASGAGVAVASAAIDLVVNPVVTIRTKSTVVGAAADAEFWGPAPANGGIVVNLGSADAVTIRWVNDAADDHRIHGNGTAVVSGGPLVRDGALPDDSNGAFDHSDAGDGTPASMFQRVLRPSDPTQDTVVSFYCHTHQNPQSTQPGQVTIKAQVAAAN